MKLKLLAIKSEICNHLQVLHGELESGYFLISILKMKFFAVTCTECQMYVHDRFSINNRIL